MNAFFLLAGGVSAFALVTHVMLGRSRPLPALAKDQPASFLYLDAWFGRHAVTLLYAAMALGFSHAAREPDARDLALTLAALALGMAALRLAFALRGRAHRLDVGEWGPIGLAGAAGMAGLMVAPPA
jgi:hypothetical protein